MRTIEHDYGQALPIPPSVSRRGKLQALPELSLITAKTNYSFEYWVRPSFLLGNAFLKPE
jgi:hypothetical protein